MSIDLKRLAEVAENPSQETLEKAEYRKQNRTWLKKSQEIALAIFYYLENANISQKEFAKILGVSPTYIGKLLKGGENLTLETISKIEVAIGADIVSIRKPYKNTEIMTVSNFGCPDFSGNSKIFKDNSIVQDFHFFGAA